MSNIDVYQVKAPSDARALFADMHRPLTHTEAGWLQDGLLEVAGYGLERLDGLLHAVAVAPGLLQLSAWLPHVLGGDPLNRNLEGSGASLFNLVLRRYHAVFEAVARGKLSLPDWWDRDACASFARGFVAGAELDSSWRNDPSSWALLSTVAHLAGRNELVSEDIREMLASEAGMDLAIRRQLGELIAAMDELFSPLREAADASPASFRAAPRRARRNEPCPCGSGRKSKRCCAG